MPERNRKAIILLKHGEGNPENQGQLKEGDRGKYFIQTLVTIERFRGLPYDHIYFAPSRLAPLAEATARALVSSDTELAFMTSAGDLKEDNALCTEAEDEWRRVTKHLPPPRDPNRPEIPMPSLYDLRMAAEEARRAGEITRDLIIEEGNRIAADLFQRMAHIDHSATILCIMQSPLIEAAIIALWEQYANPRYKSWKPLHELPMLDFLDTYTIFWINNMFDRVWFRSFLKDIKEKRAHEELLVKQLRLSRPELV